MATFDQAQASRLGQRLPSDNTAVLMFSGEDIPEAPWHGMLIYRTDLQVIQVYRSSLHGGSDAFEDVVGGVGGQLTFVGDEPPISVNIGDLWFDTDDLRKLYRAASVGASEIADGQWELMVGQVTVEHLQQNGVLVDALNAVDLSAVTMTGTTIQTTKDQQAGIKIGNVDGTPGLFIWNENQELFFKAVPGEGMAIIAGEAKLRTLTISTDDPDIPSGGSLGGEVEVAVGGSLALSAGTTAPRSAPTVTFGYDTMALSATPGALYGLCTDGENYYSVFLNIGIAATIGVAKWDSLGTFLGTTNIFGMAAHGASSFASGGVVYKGGELFVLTGSTYSNSGWRVYRLNAETLAVQDSVALSLSTQYWGGLGTDGDRLIITQNTTSGIRFRFYEYNNSTESTPATMTVEWDIGPGGDAFPYNPAGVALTSADFGGSQRLVVAARSGGNFFGFNSGTGSRLTNTDWPIGEAGLRGFFWDGSVWKALNQVGQEYVVRTYTSENVLGANSQTKWISNTLASDAYETTQSPKTKVTQPKRTKMIVNTSRIPLNSEADRVNIYVGRGSTVPSNANMFRQDAPLVGVTTAEYSALATSGAGAPSTNTFPSTSETPGKLVANVGSFSVDANSNGSVGTGTFKTSVRSAAREEMYSDNGANIRSRTTDQNLSHNTATTISWNELLNDWQDQSWFTYSAGIFTIQQAGLYIMNVTGIFETNATGYRQLLLLRNGGIGDRMRVPAISGVQTYVNVTGVYACGAGDILEVEALQNSGGTLAFIAASRFTLAKLT
jgi:hypothetical protein